MSAVHTLSRRDARRIALRAQLLTAARPHDLLATVRHLTLLQLDPTSTIAPSADLVLWSRLGTAYSRDDLRDAIDEQRLVELGGVLRPLEYVGLLRADMAEWPGTGALRGWEVAHREWVRVNDACRTDILERLRADGPLPQGELPDTCVEPWSSSGWNDDKNVAMLLDLMAKRGEVAVAGRDERGRLWDLASRVYPDEPVPPADEARRLRDELRLASLGIARETAPESLVEPQGVGRAGEPAVVEGVRGRWRIEPSLLDEAFAGRAALLSPLDRLVYDRKRTTELFEFDYQLEKYKPAAKRRWGYFALPILHGDRLVGKLDATVDRSIGVLRVDAVHRDVELTRAAEHDVEQEIRDLAAWLDVGLDLPG